MPVPSRRDGELRDVPALRCDGACLAGTNCVRFGSRSAFHLAFRGDEFAMQLRR